jgi:hypothetical protein
MAYYRNANGTYYGYSNQSVTDEGVVKVPIAPKDARDTWNGKSWGEDVIIPDDHPS